MKQGAPARGHFVEPRRLGDLFHPGNIRVMRGMKALAETEPAWKVAKWVVEALNIRVEITRGTVPLEGALLLVGGKPSSLAGLVTGSVITRDDYYFIAGPFGTKWLGKSMAEHCLPTFTTAKFSDNFMTAFRARFMYPRIHGVRPENAASKNLAALKRAAEILNEGRAFGITPAGGTIGVADNWKHGIGYIIKHVGDVPVQVVLISLRGMTRRDVMRLLNPYWFGGTRKPLPVTIELSDPIQLSEFRGPGMSSTRISLRVRDRFIKEFGSL